MRAAEWPTVYGRLFANWGLGLSGLGTEADFEARESADGREAAPAFERREDDQDPADA